MGPLENSSKVLMKGTQKGNRGSRSKSKGSSRRNRGVNQPGPLRNYTPFSYVPPSSRRIRLTWVGAYNLTESAVGVGVEKILRLNAAYDVDPSVGSTSTPGFAEQAAIFANYRVWATSVRVVGTFTGGSAGTFVEAFMYPNATNVFLGSGGSWVTAPGVVKKPIRADNTGGTNVVTLLRRFNLPAVARLTPLQYSIPLDWTASVTSVPPRLIQMAFGFTSTGSSTVVTMNALCYMQMDIEFFNPIQLSV